jgi:hypothetical protein
LRDARATLFDACVVTLGIYLGGGVCS